MGWLLSYVIPLNAWLVVFGRMCFVYRVMPIEYIDLNNIYLSPPSIHKFNLTCNPFRCKLKSISFGSNLCSVALMNQLWRFLQNLTNSLS